MNTNMNTIKVFTLTLSAIILTFVDQSNEIHDNNKNNEFWCANTETYNEELISTPQITTRIATNAILELAVFYDDSFYYKFHNNLNDFLRTLFRQTQIIFEYQSLEPSIRLIVKVVERVRISEVRYNHKTESVDDYLSKLCVWQNNKYPHSMRKHHYDIAVFLTTQLLHSKIRNEVYGLAYMATACNTGDKNCLLSRIEGFHSANILAHEIAHVLGAFHDFNHPFVTCDQGIMCPHTETRYHWSNCSNIFINYYLQQTYFNQSIECLLNLPEIYLWDFKESDVFVPGIEYDYDKQCQMLYGTKYKRDNMDFTNSYSGVQYKKMLCQKITCAYGIFQISPELQGNLLEGTKCVANTYTGKCVLGVCV